MGPSRLVRAPADGRRCRAASSISPSPGGIVTNGPLKEIDRVLGFIGNALVAALTMASHLLRLTLVNAALRKRKAQMTGDFSC